MVTRDYNYSRPLDVHRWSCYTETNTFVNSIYEQHFLTDKANKTIRKKLLKVVLLDLYVAWIDDPNLCIGVHMSPNAYSDGTVLPKGQSRYNELYIKHTIIQVIHRLKDLRRLFEKEDYYYIVNINLLYEDENAMVHQGKYVMEGVERTPVSTIYLRDGRPWS